MKTLIRGIMAISVLASAAMLQAQTADEVIAKHLEAIGGKDAISQVKSITMDTMVEVMGTEAPGTTIIADGVGFKNVTDFNGSKIIQCYNDKGGWNVNPMMGAADPTPMTDDEYLAGKAQINVGGPLYDYAARGSKVELVSKDGGVFKIKLTSKDNVETTFVIDGATYLVKSVTAKGKMQGQDVDVTTSYSDYRKQEGGYMLPYTMDIDLGQFALTVKVTKVELNKPIDPAIFVMPKATT